MRVRPKYRPMGIYKGRVDNVTRTPDHGIGLTKVDIRFPATLIPENEP